MTTFKLAIADETADIEVRQQGDALHVMRDGQTAVFRIIDQTDGIWTVVQELADGRQQRLRLAGQATGDKRQIWVNGRTFHAQRVRERSADAAGPAGSLSATIPAVVAEILVGVGDTVQAGDKLILLESMKMVIPIQAPSDGVVTAVHCQPGESVQAGVPLIEVEGK